jgi:hypothetical protein
MAFFAFTFKATKLGNFNKLIFSIRKQIFACLSQKACLMSNSQQEFIKLGLVVCKCDKSDFE